ncbi:hypothetical protein ABIA38_006659 [Embleya sp. AB8]
MYEAMRLHSVQLVTQRTTAAVELGGVMLPSGRTRRTAGMRCIPTRASADARRRSPRSGGWRGVGGSRDGMGSFVPFGGPGSSASATTSRSRRCWRRWWRSANAGTSGSQRTPRRWRLGPGADREPDGIAADPRAGGRGAESAGRRARDEAEAGPATTAGCTTARANPPRQARRRSPSRNRIHHHARHRRRPPQPRIHGGTRQKQTVTARRYPWPARSSCTRSASAYSSRPYRVPWRSDRTVGPHCRTADCFTIRMPFLAMWAARLSSYPPDLVISRPSER